MRSNTKKRERWRFCVIVQLFRKGKIEGAFNHVPNARQNFPRYMNALYMSKGGTKVKF